jgi:hypothetical protein
MLKILPLLEEKLTVYIHVGQARVCPEITGSGWGFAHPLPVISGRSRKSMYFFTALQKSML